MTFHSQKKKIVNNFILKNNKLSKLSENQLIKFKIDYLEPVKILEIIIEIDKIKQITLKKNYQTNKFEIKETIKQLKKEIVYKETKISNSLYASAINEEIDPSIIVNFARIYGFQIDFQRDIWKNDTFQIM